MKEPFISIIIPCRKIDPYVRECIKHCRKLNYSQYEIILLTDHQARKIDGVKILTTGSVTPAAKRNIGTEFAKGNYLAFIDSDAYPDRDWLKNALKYFKLDVLAVGGLNITPDTDSLMQKASGYVFASRLVGNLARRCRSSKAIECDDIPSSNFIIKKKVLTGLGGWVEKYYPAEDTHLCNLITKGGWKIINAPDVIVYHHRRPLFKQHLTQVSRFGLHRGFFAKKYGGNSLRLTYFIPSISLISLIILSLLNIEISMITIFLYSTFALGVAVSETRRFEFYIPVWLGLMLTHLTYAIFFIIGLSKRSLIQ